LSFTGSAEGPPSGGGATFEVPGIGGTDVDILTAVFAGATLAARTPQAPDGKLQNAAAQKAALPGSRRGYIEGVRLEMRQAVAGISGKLFYSEEDAALALDVSLSVLTRKHGIEMFAFIYQVNGVGDRSYYFIGAPTTSFHTEMVDLSLVQYDSQPTIGVPGATISATWHSHPNRQIADFSRLGNASGGGKGDLEGYVWSKQNGYVSNVDTSTLLKFDNVSYRQTMDGLYGRTNFNTLSQYICVVKGSSASYGGC
jgi:hypothetical protein